MIREIVLSCVFIETSAIENLATLIRVLEFESQTYIEDVRGSVDEIE